MTALDALTTLLPTRDRPAECIRQLNFLEKSGYPCRIIVLDASAAGNAETIRAACTGIADYRHFGRDFRMADKLAVGVAEVTTPFVNLIPDDDIILPHALRREVEFLSENSDFIAAHGYFLCYAPAGNDFDIHAVDGFTPSITDASPLRRHYDLFRRYQSFYWGVFRTEVFATAVQAATAMKVVLFRELTVMSTAILQGKVARFPVVHTLRGATPSHAALRNSNPLFWAIDDAESFFSAYRVYRDAIAGFIQARGIEVPSGVRLEQLLDMSHATWLGRSVDVGMLNYATQRLLGDDLPPIGPPSGPTGGAASDEDLIHPSTTRSRRYIWRKSVTQAEPRHEISIGAEEIDRVERQLDAFG